MSFCVNPQNHKALAYGAFRLALGVVELMHGLVRVPVLGGFAANMVKQFEGTILPGRFVYSFGSLLPFLEGLIGLALILGLFTQDLGCRFAPDVDPNFQHLPAVGLGYSRTPDDLCLAFFVALFWSSITGTQ
jgi:hypothetical protein